MGFGQETSDAIDLLVEKANRAMQETAIESFGYVVAHTPITSGDAISAWKFGMVGAEVGTIVNFHNKDTNATTNWSIATSSQLGETFKIRIAPMVHDTTILESMYIENDNDHIMMLENGGYSGRTYYKDMAPYYVNRYKPFVLSARGKSIKLRKFNAARGMVKNGVRKSKQYFKHFANKYNR